MNSVNSVKYHIQCKQYSICICKVTLKPDFLDLNSNQITIKVLKSTIFSIVTSKTTTMT